MSTALLAWIVTYLLHSTLLVLGAWVLDTRWRDRPERMSAVWKTALLGGVLTATVQTGLGVTPMAGHWDLSSSDSATAEAVLPSARSVTAPAAEPVMVAVIPSVEPPSSSRWRSDAITSLMGPERSAPVTVEAAPRRTIAPSIAHTSIVGSSPAAPVATADHRSAAPSVEASSTTAWLTGAVPWLVGLSLVGAALGFASVLAAFVALRRQLRGRRALPEGPLTTQLERLRQRAGLSRRVPLTMAPRVRVPMAVGVLRPEIVVPPQAATGLSAAHQQSLLAHELAHVLRHDPAWRVIALLVERVFFFQPLNRLASARLAQTAEYLCDDWAARHTAQPLALASCLTEIATWVARPGPVVATMSGPRSILGRRVHRLLQPSPERARPPWLAVALGLPLLGLVIAAPGVTAHAQSDDQPRDQPRDQPHEVDQAAAPRVVVSDHQGRRWALVIDDDDVLVTRDDEGSHLVVHADDHEEPGDRADRRAARKADRRRRRANDEARREASTQLRRAFREARRRGEAVPSRGELEAIVRRIEHADPTGERHHAPEAPQSVELHVVLPEHARALHDAARARQQAARVQQDARERARESRRVRAWHEAMRAHGAEGPAAIRQRLPDAQRNESLGAPELEMLQRELEAVERELRREHRRRSAPAEFPTVLRRPVAPARPPARSDRAAPEAPRVPVAPAPPARLRRVAPAAPPSPPEPPVVWVSLPAPPVPAPAPT